MYGVGMAALQYRTYSVNTYVLTGTVLTDTLYSEDEQVLGTEE